MAQTGNTVLLEQTGEHLTTRKKFGQSRGSRQVRRRGRAARCHAGVFSSADARHRDTVGRRIVQAGMSVRQTFCERHGARCGRSPTVLQWPMLGMRRGGSLLHTD
ncbi:hypothetical protein LJR039_007500 [Pseudorhodoferax sp. LjRoot39]|uniref:hypothetical protein n=1 Tax=Pseudorhodoferax sp. LjRoot39 TaxID=3342328 RepID=UPI003ECF7FBE